MDTALLQRPAPTPPPGMLANRALPALDIEFNRPVITPDRHLAGEMYRSSRHLVEHLNTLYQALEEGHDADRLRGEKRRVIAHETFNPRDFKRVFRIVFQNQQGVEAVLDLDMTARAPVSRNILRTFGLLKTKPELRQPAIVLDGHMGKLFEDHTQTRVEVKAVEEAAKTLFKQLKDRGYIKDPNKPRMVIDDGRPSNDDVIEFETIEYIPRIRRTRDAIPGNAIPLTDEDKKDIRKTVDDFRKALNRGWGRQTLFRSTRFVMSKAHDRLSITFRLKREFGSAAFTSSGQLQYSPTRLAYYPTITDRDNQETDLKSVNLMSIKAPSLFIDMLENAYFVPVDEVRHSMSRSAFRKAMIRGKRAEALQQNCENRTDRYQARCNLKAGIYPQ